MLHLPIYLSPELPFTNSSQMSFRLTLVYLDQNEKEIERIAIIANQNVLWKRGILYRQVIHVSFG